MYQNTFLYEKGTHFRSQLHQYFKEIGTPYNEIINFEVSKIKLMGSREECSTRALFVSYLYSTEVMTSWPFVIVMVPNKRSLHQASGSGLELGTCNVSLATVVITDPRIV